MLTYKVVVQAFGEPNNVEFHEHYSDMPVIRAGAGWSGKKVNLGYRFVQHDTSDEHPNNQLTFSTSDYQKLFDVDKAEQEKQKLKKAADDF